MSLNNHYKTRRYEHELERATSTSIQNGIKDQAVRVRHTCLPPLFPTILHGREHHAASQRGQRGKSEPNLPQAKQTTRARRRDAFSSAASSGSICTGRASCACVGCPGPLERRVNTGLGGGARCEERSDDVGLEREGDGLRLIEGMGWRRRRDHSAIVCATCGAAQVCDNIRALRL